MKIRIITVTITRTTNMGRGCTQHHHSRLQWASSGEADASADGGNPSQTTTFRHTWKRCFPREGATLGAAQQLPLEERSSSAGRSYGEIPLDKEAVWAPSLPSQTHRERLNPLWTSGWERPLCTSAWREISWFPL